MFRAGEIITATQLIKKFKLIARFIHATPIPILITQKKLPPMVLLPVDLFEDLMNNRNQDAVQNFAPPTLKDYLLP